MGYGYGWSTTSQDALLGNQLDCCFVAAILKKALCPAMLPTYNMYSRQCTMLFLRSRKDAILQETRARRFPNPKPKQTVPPAQPRTRSCAPISLGTVDPHNFRTA